jgi:hypothetical protein
MTEVKALYGRRALADRLCPDGADCGRREEDRRAHEESGELRASRL